jgi:hypothetical protein
VKLLSSLASPIMHMEKVEHHLRYHLEQHWCLRWSCWQPGHQRDQLLTVLLQKRLSLSMHATNFDALVISCHHILKGFPGRKCGPRTVRLLVTTFDVCSIDQSAASTSLSSVILCYVKNIFLEHLNWISDCCWHCAVCIEQLSVQRFVCVFLSANYFEVCKAA